MTEVVELEIKMGRLAECAALISSPTFLQVCPCPAYFAALSQLIQANPKSLAAVETRYAFADGTKVVLFDIKCSAHFEDYEIERLYREWNSGTYSCPFRRGMCLGMVNSKLALVCVGNAKFFYPARGEQDILSHLGGQVVVSEKANGECTMLSTSKADDRGLRWLVFGSKNVRVALPYRASQPSDTLLALKSFTQRYQSTLNSIDNNKQLRFGMVVEMIPLWLDMLQSSQGKLLEVLDSGCTVVGEQVGVHLHIAQADLAPQIQLFAAIPFAKLHEQPGCDLRTLPFVNHLHMVKFIAFDMPQQRDECKQYLLNVASGPLSVYGEGVVVYLYDDGKDGKKGMLKQMYKFKCQEYAFDRKLRSLLSKLVLDLASRTPSIATAALDPHRLQRESVRIIAELDKSLQMDFTAMDSTRAKRRTALVPAIIAFLVQQQRDCVYWKDFSGQFVNLLALVEAESERYLTLAKKLFDYSPATTIPDPLLGEWNALLTKYAAVEVPIKSVDDTAAYVAKEWKARGGQAKFPLIGIAASPAGGKTKLLRKLSQLLPNSVLCDRDAYCIQSAREGEFRSEVAHLKWIADIKYHLSLGEVVLAGNTFSGTFASTLEKQLSSSLLLFVFQEHLRMDNWFHLQCLRRLSRRQHEYADESTLTMFLGSAIVLNKYFTSLPNSSMLSKRLKDGNAIVFSVLRPPVVGAAILSPRKDLGMFLEDVERLKAHALNLSKPVLSPPTISKSVLSPPTVSKPLPKSKLAKTLFTRYVKLPTAPPPTNNSGILFIGLAPNADTLSRFLALGDDELLRTDAHLTLYFQPTAEQLVYSQKQLPIPFPVLFGTHLITVAMEASRETRLQCVKIQPIDALVGCCCEYPPHVTLGTTNYDLLPTSTSGKALALIDQLSPTILNHQPIQLENGWWIWIEPLTEIKYEGEVSFYASSLSAASPVFVPHALDIALPSSSSAAAAAAGLVSPLCSRTNNMSSAFVSPPPTPTRRSPTEDHHLNEAVYLNHPISHELQSYLALPNTSELIVFGPSEATISILQNLTPLPVAFTAQLTICFPKGTGVMDMKTQFQRLGKLELEWLVVARPKEGNAEQQLVLAICQPHNQLA
ncbi:hypothetical protein BASA81_004239, partial [Batrachochytrium salamandrivorans]